MKRFLLIITVILTSVSAAWAEDYNQGYYTMSPGAGSTYFGMYAFNNADACNHYSYGATTVKTNAIVFTFEETEQDNVYYWFDCNNKKYIYSDSKGYLAAAENKVTNDNNYKWFIKDDGTGNLTITDMTNYNNGNPTKGLIQLNSVGGWWASKCTLSSNSGRNTWKLNLLMKKNTPYYISLPGRSADRYLQYNENKMQQVAVSEKGTNHVWYFTDAGNGVVNIYSLENQNNAMGYASNAGNGDDKISTTNSDKAFYIRLTGNDSAPLAFLTNAIDKNNSLYLSNNGGTGKTNMGLWQEVDEGTRMKIDEISFEDCINTAKDFLEGTHAGHPGFHTYEANAALHSAITTAEGVKTPTISDFYSLLNAIKTFKSAETIKLVEGKTYRFVSASTNKPGYVISVNNDNYLIWEALNETNNKQLWKVTGTETGLLATIQNVGTGLHPQGRLLNSTSVIKYQFYLGESATKTQIVDLGSYSGQFNINPNSQHSMHMLNHESSNTTDKIISWDNTDINSPSAWYIYEYEEYNIVVNGCDNGRIIINGVEYANGEKFYNFKNADFTTSAKIINYYYAGNVSISGNTISLEYTSMDITVPDGSNGFVAGIRSIGETEWRTQGYWDLADAWDSDGPGRNGSNMWKPIYLKGVTASDINLEGWDLQLTLVNSSLTATTNKLQTTNSNGMVSNIDEKSTLDLTWASSTSIYEGKHIFNVDGKLIFRPQGTFPTDISSETTINLGESGTFNFEASSSVTTNKYKSFIINVTPVEPENYNTILSQETPFATFKNVTILGNLTFSATDTEKWTKVNSVAALSTQTDLGEHCYYYIEETTPSNGVKEYRLHTYKQIIHEVTTEEILSEIDNHENIRYFNVPSSSTLIIDVELEEGQMIKAAATTSTIYINNGIKLNANDITGDYVPQIIGDGTLNINMTDSEITTALAEHATYTLLDVSYEDQVDVAFLTINGDEKYSIGDYDYYIIQDESSKDIVLVKHYIRSVTSGNFGSICIPNGSLVSQMTGIEKVLKVTKITDASVVMDEVDEMEAGVPYIFKSNENKINLTLLGESVSGPVNNTQNYLVGNFGTPVYVPNSDEQNSYYVLQSNQFKKVTSASTIKSGSNRCYLKVPVTSQSRMSTLGIAVDEGGATGIDALNALINNNAEIYDINGRKLKDLRKGINIVNGVKVLVK